MLEVVEDDQQIAQHQRHVRQPERVGTGVTERLDGAHEVVAEVADGASGKRRQSLHRGLRVTLDGRRRDRVGVAAIGQAPAQHLARAKAEERVAPEALALLG